MDDKTMNVPAKIMDNFYICLCVNKASFGKYANIIKQFGGSVQNTLQENTGCLVTETVRSESFKKAQRRDDVHCVTVKWLLDCQKHSKTMKFESYKVPPFLGLMMSCTDVPPQDRPTLNEAITLHGGIFSPALLKDKCTHLIQGENNGKMSEKYCEARRWKLQIVSQRWITDCIRLGSEY